MPTLNERMNMDVWDVQKKSPDLLSIEEDVYLSLLGTLLPEYTLDWVENIFVPGTPYSENMKTIYNCATTASEKLGIINDYDRDIQDIMDACDRNERIIAHQMFKYGMKYQAMLNAEKEK